MLWLSRTIPEDGEEHIVHEKLPFKKGEARGSVSLLWLCCRRKKDKEKEPKSFCMRKGKEGIKRPFKALFGTNHSHRRQQVGPFVYPFVVLVVATGRDDNLTQRKTHALYRVAGKRGKRAKTEFWHLKFVTFL